MVGGKHLLVGSVELERALFEDWGVSVFYDAGNAFDSFTGVRLFAGGRGRGALLHPGGRPESLAGPAGRGGRPGLSHPLHGGVRAVKRAAKYGLIALLAAALIGAGVLGAAWLAGTTDGARWLMDAVSRHTPLTISARTG